MYTITSSALPVIILKFDGINALAAAISAAIVLPRSTNIPVAVSGRTEITTLGDLKLVSLRAAVAKPGCAFIVNGLNPTTVGIGINASDWNASGRCGRSVPYSSLSDNHHKPRVFIVGVATFIIGFFHPQTTLNLGRPPTPLTAFFLCPLLVLEVFLPCSTASDVGVSSESINDDDPIILSDN